MAEIIDQCHGGALCKTTTRDSFLQAMEAGNQAFAHAFPSAGMIKKWHWLLHLPDSYARYGHLPSCFTCERKHKTISSYATILQHTEGYEIHLLQKVVPNQILSLQQEGVFPNEATLVRPRKATQKQREIISIFLLQPCEDAQSSMCARLAQRGQIFNEDVIIYRCRMESCTSPIPCASLWHPSNFGPGVGDPRIALGQAICQVQCLQPIWFCFLEQHPVSSDFCQRQWWSQSAASFSNLCQSYQKINNNALETKKVAHNIFLQKQCLAILAASWAKAF
jgi:hypothetical protein